jgi:hypothetical protein
MNRVSAGPARRSNQRVQTICVCSLVGVRHNLATRGSTLVSVSVGWAHDSSPFVRMSRNPPNVSEWNIQGHNFAGASVGRLALILVVLWRLVVAAAVFPRRAGAGLWRRFQCDIYSPRSALGRSSQLVVWSLPSTYTLEPLATCSPTVSARRCQDTQCFHGLAGLRNSKADQFAATCPVCPGALRLMPTIRPESNFRGLDYLSPSSRPSSRTSLAEVL